MRGEIREPRRNDAGRALLVPILAPVGGGGAFEQLEIAVELIQIPVRGILCLDLGPHLVEQGALVGKQCRVVVARALHDRAPRVTDTEQFRDEAPDVGSEPDEQLRDRYVVEIRAQVPAVVEIRLVEFPVGIAHGIVERRQQALQALVPGQVGELEAIQTQGKIP